MGRERPCRLPAAVGRIFPTIGILSAGATSVKPVTGKLQSVHPILFRRNKVVEDIAGNPYILGVERTPPESARVVNQHVHHVAVAPGVFSIFAFRMR